MFTDKRGVIIDKKTPNKKEIIKTKKQSRKSMLLGSFFGGINNKSQNQNSNLQINNNSKSQNIKKPKNNTLNRIRLKVMELRYLPHLEIRLVHDKVYSKGGKYKKWTDNPKSKDVHRTTAYAFFFSFVIFTLAQSLFPIFDLGRPDRAYAAQNSVTWTTRADFESATTRIGVDSESIPDSLRLRETERGVIVSSGTGANLSSISFADSSTGYISGTGGTVLRTIDGGASWSILSVGTTEFLSAIYSPSPNVAYVTRSISPFGVHRTTDGGLTWEPIQFGSGLLVDIHGTGSDNIQANDRHNVYRTVNGVDWVRTLNSINTDKRTIFVGPGSTASLGAIAGGGSGRVWHSSNSGQSWSTGLTDGISFAEVFDNYFVTSLVGYNVRNNQVRRTLNGGSVWTTIATLPTGVVLNTVVFRDTNIGYVAGSNGVAYRTTDGGLSWHVLSLGTSQNVNDSFVTDGGQVYFVANGGLIIRLIPSIELIGGLGSHENNSVGLRADAGAGVRARPSSLTWNGSTALAGQRILFKVRTGDTQAELDTNQCYGPTALDVGCADWTTPGRFFSQINGQANSSTAISPSIPNRRFIEVLVRMESSGANTPTLNDVTLTFDTVEAPVNANITISMTDGTSLKNSTGANVPAGAAGGWTSENTVRITANNLTCTGCTGNLAGRRLEVQHAPVGSNFPAISPANTWTTMASAPALIHAGSSLSYPGSGDFIYGFQGNNTTAFFRYSISANTWTALASAPVVIGHGSHSIAPGGDFIYTFQAGNTNGFLRYSISGNTWTTMATAPGAVAHGGALVSPGGNFIYAFQGNSTASFFRYSISANTWTTMASPPATIGAGSSLVYPGTGDFIYATRGLSNNTFFRYSISTNTWITMAAAPATIEWGGSLTYPGSGDFIYGFRGNTTTDFFRYSISANTWTTMAATPEAIGAGGVLVAPGGNFIYGFRGGVTNTFFRYSISATNILSGNSVGDPNGAVSSTVDITGLTPGNYHFRMRVVDDAGRTSGWVSYGGNVDIGNLWNTMTAAPATIADGGALVYSGTGDFIYATRGGTTNTFYRYSISGNTWTTMAVAPGTIADGGALVYSGTGDFIYATRGGTTNTFYRYSISGNTWATMAAAPGNIGIGGALVAPGNDFIYGFQGNSATAFFRYSISTNTWTTMATAPGTIAAGGALVYPGTGNFIYATRGGTTNTFYRYSISGNTWTTMAVAPGTIGPGGALTYPGTGDFIYATRGGTTNTFYRYSISGNTWTTMAAAPGNIGIGGALVAPGNDFIYGFQGGTTNAFYRYSIGSDFSVETTAPTITSSLINNNAQATNQNTVTLNITAQDTGGSNLSMMRFSNDNTTWSTWENFNSVKTGWTLTAGDGTKTVFTQVQDNAGNVSTTASDNIFFDTTPPTVLSNTITSPNGGEFWSGGTHRDITWNTNSVTDATSGLRGTNGNQAITLFYSDDNRSTWNLISENLNNGNNGCTNPTSGCFRWLLPNVQSEHVWIRITAIDNAGNQSFAPGHFDTSDARFTLEADTNAPEFPEYTPSVSPHHLREGINYTSGNTTLAWSLPTDRGSGVTNFSLWVRQVGVDTNFRLLNSLTLDQTSKVLTLSEGAWEWRLRAIDVVGLTTDSPIYQVTVDTTAPSGTLRLFPNLNNGITATRSSNVHLDVTNINDTASGYHEVSFSNSATGPWSAFQEETNFTNWDLSNMLLGGNNNQGTKTVFIRLRDRVGNTSSVVSGSIVWDSTTPLHPGNLRLTNTVNQRSTFVDNAWRGTSTTRLNWDAAVDPANPVASGVHQYLVYRAKESNNPNNATLLGVTTNLFWNDTNLLDSRTYHYWVQVVDMAQNSSDHTLSTPALLLLSDITPPETPRNFVASGLNDSVVRIDFRAAPDNSLVFDGVAQRYRIFRAGPFLTEPLGDPTTYNYDLYLAELPFKEDGNYRLDDDVTPERWYYYRLIAFDAAGLESNPIFHRARGNFAQVFNQEDITLSVNNQRTPETVRPGDTLTINFKVTDQDGRVDLDTGNAAQRVRIVNGLGNEVLPFTSVTQKTDHENGGHLGYSYTFTYLIPENASYGTYTTSIHVATSVATGNPGANPHNQLRMVNFRVPPQSPTALSAVGHTSSAVRLSWVAPGNSNNQQGLRTTQTYKVERREDAGNFVLAGHTTQTNFTDTGLTIDTEYTYRVRAYDISQNPGSWSLEVSARTPKPNTPTSASVQEASHNNILMGGSFPVRYLVSWDAVWRGEEAGQVPDLRGYKVFRATNLIWDPNPIAEIDILRAGFNQTYFLDVHPASLENAIFQYRIKPWDEAGNLGDYVETPRTTATEVPQLVSQPTVTETGVSWVKLRWMSNQPSYGVVQYKKASEARYRSLAGDPEVTTTKDGNNYVHIITVDGLEKGTVYNFRVQSVNVANVISTFSNEITASTRPFNISDIQRRITASSATISWRTVGVSSQGLVEYRRGNAETKVLGTGRDAEDHSVSLSALSPGDYVFTLRNIDSEGNIATSGLESFTITGFDEGAISSPQAGQIEEKNITATSARITWRSTVPTTSWIDYGTNSGRYTSSTGSDSLTTNHIVTLEGLTPGTTYFYRVRGIDANGIEYISREYSFTAVLQPEISNIRLNLVSPYIAEVTFDTNVDTEASITFGKDNNLDLKAGNTELRRGHLIRLENLEDGANYRFLVEVRDALGNLVRSEPQPFSTPIDKAGPKVQNIKIDILPMGEADETASVIISWNTNKPSTTKVEYDAGVIGTNLTKSTVEDTALNTSHTVVIRDLEPATTYRFKIAGVDRRDNPTESSTYTFVTPARERSILQLIIRSLEETFAWTRNVGSFFNNVWNRD